ncbi:MAG TPA: methyltransferase, partial [Candidatus Nanoarchaeia archaeon]|nr:methyltransferase [Candidatus Nanoarchaeia archaeon]
MKPNPDQYYTENPTSQARFGIVSTCLRGKPFEFTTGSSVFSIKHVDLGTRILVESMILPDDGLILDLGCGYGVVGIAAAKFNPKLQVVMTDVNRRAVLLSRQNAEKNHAFNVEVRQGNLYAPVQNYCFNCVLSNPPVSAGMQVVEEIIRGAPSVIAKGATLQIVLRS